ncbi:MAG: AAA family ATPase [Bellilinea sp.]
MIKVDYAIERNEGDEIKSFVPDLIPSQLCNIVYIQGPNSSGKSTLLNLIALAFFGNKLNSDDIDQSLRNKINNLTNLDHQKITFEISIDNPEMGITLISQKTDKNTQDIVVKKIVDGKATSLSSESFFREFKLIYDIPHDPLERLPQLLSEVNNTQKDVGQRIQQLRQYLWKLIEEIKNSQDPNELANMKSKYEYLHNQKSKMDQDIRKLKSHTIKVNEYGYAKAYITYNEQYRNENKRLKELNQELEIASKQGRKKATDQTRILKTSEKAFNDCQSKYEEVYRLLTPHVSKSDQVHFKLWKQSVLHDEIYHPEIYKTLREETKYFIKAFKEKLDLERMTREKDLKAIELYKFLLSSLSNQKFNDVNLPGINQSVESFLLLISKELNANENLILELNELENCKKSLEELNQLLLNTINIFQELKSVDTQDYDGINLDGIKNEKTIVENRLKNIDHYVLHYRDMLVKYKVDPVKVDDFFENLSHEDEMGEYSLLSIDEVITKGKDFINLVHSQEEQLLKIDSALDKLKNEIMIMENKSPHEFHEKLDILNYYYQKIQRLEQRFKKQYSEYIEHVLKGDNLGKRSDDEKKYIMLIGKFLAAKLHTIKHIEKEYEIANISMLDQKIYTTSNKEIFFADLGTGQSQAAFLSAKLAINDKKKIIAMFDEVAMMDENSLRPVKEKIVDLYKKKKLFMAIIVQKSDIVKIESLL